MLTWLLVLTVRSYDYAPPSEEQNIHVFTWSVLSVIPIRCSLLAIGHLCQRCPFVFEMAHRPGDHPEDFNAFGYDPRGHVANFAGLMFGENWRPDQQRVPRFDGPQVAPPRYGPPADYQHHYLPENFIPRPPHNGYLGALQFQRREGPWANCFSYPPPPP